MKKTARVFSNEKIAEIISTIKEYIVNESPLAKVLSGGQHKVGDIPRWNMPPLVTCGENCKFCKGRCYVLKDYTGPRKKSVAKSHARNYNAVMEDMLGTMATIIEYCQKHKPAFFRIHASGDFAVPGLGDTYAWMWYEIAESCPDTKFLAFTKAFDEVRTVPFYELPNFSLVLSEWTDVLEAPAGLKEHYPTSRAVESLDDVRDDELVCPGNCETCGMCWALKELGKNVAFEIH